MSVVISCEWWRFLEPLRMTLTRLNALQYTKVLVVLTPFCDTVCTILLSSASSPGVKTQMPVVSMTTGICRVYTVYFARRFRASGLQPRRGLTDLHACCFQSFLLRLGGTGGTGDNSACVAHGLTLRSGEACNVTNDGLGQILATRKYQ